MTPKQDLHLYVVLRTSSQTAKLSKPSCVHELIYGTENRVKYNGITLTDYADYKNSNLVMGI